MAAEVLDSERHAASLCMQGKAGYLKWREDLKNSHASTVVGIMAEIGYGAASQDKVC